MEKGLPLWREWGAPEVSPLAAGVQERIARGLPVHDFITANPYDHGFRFNADLLKTILANAGAAASRYAADALGNLSAREAVAGYYGNGVSPAQVVLTPGTSLGYFYLFRLLARPHGEVLCPAPTYPLFDDLAKIAGLTVRRYHLDKTVDPQGTTRWVIDPKELQFQITSRTCAIVLVSPHNPTGTIISDAAMGSVCQIANSAGVPVIMDEVFRTYARQQGAPVPRPSEFDCQLSFTLNGLSKSHYLPGLKAGWIVVEGKGTTVTVMLNALEYISDSFLPMQEITQAAIADLLGPQAMAEAGRLAALQRTTLDAKLLQSSGWTMETPQAGPYLCLPLNSNDDAQIASRLLEEQGGLFHPGHLYAFPDPYLVATIYNKSRWPES